VATGVAAASVVGVSVWALVLHPPLQSLARGELGLRTNTLTGDVSLLQDGSVWVLPGLHRLRVVSLRDQSWHAQAMAQAKGPAPAQTIEGLSIGLDLSLRYAIDASQLASKSGKGLPDDLALEVVEPAVQGVVYKVVAQHTVREIFSTQRAQIQQQIEAELRGKLAAEGLLLRAVVIGNIDLPADYRKGLDTLLAEGLATEKMRYTLELKDKRVKETELDALADKVRRETAAEATAREQIIAAKGQEEAMKHVLPFKQRQIEQRQLEAEAERQARVKTAEGAAQARRIEAQGEAEARQKLADAEAYRLARVGKANAEQMATEGALISRHPLLIQKAMADRLSDKIQVIIAPTPSSGGFIGDALVGVTKTKAAVEPGTAPAADQATQEQ
jgi:regulator of protease activity HflC (stomatin/prohibitin superfamily)